jgi:phosphoesterase RecJ-like protein
MQNRALELINSSHYVLILTHINPDADTISCALALSNYMYHQKIKHKVFNSVKQIPRVLDFLPRFDKITDQIPKFYDLVIYVDCADEKRVDIEILEDTKIINIDHHQSNTFFADVNIVNEYKASTAEVLFDFFKENKIEITKNMAQCLYVGIYDDSIAFTTPRTNYKTFEMVNELVQTGINPSDIANKLLRRESLAKFRIMPKILETLQLHFEGEVATVHLNPQWIKQTGAKLHECDDIVNMVLNISIVNIVAYFRIIDNKVRVSLRSKQDIDVSNIAKNFNGGGHQNAAGLTIDSIVIEDAKFKVLKTIKNYI